MNSRGGRRAGFPAERLERAPPDRSPEVPAGRRAVRAVRRGRAPRRVFPLAARRAALRARLLPLPGGWRRARGDEARSAASPLPAQLPARRAAGGGASFCSPLLGRRRRQRVSAGARLCRGGTAAASSPEAARGAPCIWNRAGVRALFYPMGKVGSTLWLRSSGCVRTLSLRFCVVNPASKTDVRCLISYLKQMG